MAATKYREEQRAAHQVEKLGFEYYLPLTVTSNRYGEERKILLFSGFLFVLLQDDWDILRYAKKSLRLLMAPQGLDEEERIPAQVRPGDIESLRRLEDEDGVVRFSPRFCCGESARVAVGGIYTGIVGIVTEASYGMVKLSFRMLGKPTVKEFREIALEAA